MPSEGARSRLPPSRPDGSKPPDPPKTNSRAVVPIIAIEDVPGNGSYFPGRIYRLIDPVKFSGSL